MAIIGFELVEIGRLLTLVAEHTLDELIVEEEGRLLRIRGTRRGSRRTWDSVPSLALPPPTGQASPARKAIPPAPDGAGANEIALTAPMAGTFYRAEKPGAPPLLEIGDRVTTGQTIGIIEAMKIFSEVPAEHPGIVTAIPVQDGQFVQTDMPLIILSREEPGGSGETAKSDLTDH